ncbi:MAG: DUF692 domain-containing protein [Gammaproteobacteria bacterium]|nr:DUF692 domain-containing protein [Gammaproteobacteria bacterium]
MNITHRFEQPVSGAGLGLRRELVKPLLHHKPDEISFFEVAPENWMGLGGRLGKEFRAFTERYPFVTHGLSLSIGSPAPLDEEFLKKLKVFLDHHGILAYTEHLSYCSDDGHLYDLMPIPFTDEAVSYVANRIRRVQEILERRIAIENVSYYAAPGQEISEIDFIRNVLEEADCGLLLDVNNIVVNSINHDYDAEQYLRALPADRVFYFHIAGHYVEAEDLRVDTHGSDVSEQVWALLDTAYDHCGPVATLLERDFNIPAVDDLLIEINRIRDAQTRWHARQPQNMRASHG